MVTLHLAVDLWRFPPELFVNVQVELNVNSISCLENVQDCVPIFLKSVLCCYFLVYIYPAP